MIIGGAGEGGRGKVAVIGSACSYALAARATNLRSGPGSTGLGHRANPRTHERSCNDELLVTVLDSRSPTGLDRSKAGSCV